MSSSLTRQQVNLFKVGFLQTLYDSSISWYYSPAKQGFLGRLLPSIFGNRVEEKVACPTPVRDGDAGVMPWYEVGDVKQFDEAAKSNKATDIYDRPSSRHPWKRNFAGKEQYLVKTSGQDVFRTFLAVQNTENNSLYRMNYVDWKVDYGADVKVNTINPASSVVTPTTGGAQIMTTAEGPGSKSPAIGDPVANDVVKSTLGGW